MDSTETTNDSDLTRDSVKGDVLCADSDETQLNQEQSRNMSSQEIGKSPVASKLRDEMFVDFIAKGKTQSEAYRLAGFNDNGNAGVCASNKVQKVTDLLAERRAYFRSIANIEAEDIIGAQTEIAFGNFEEAFDEFGNYNHQKAVATGAFRLIKKVSTTYSKMGKTVNVEAYSRADALSQLAEMLGLKKAPQKNSARARLLDAIEKVMRIENISFAAAYQYIVQKQKDGEVQLFTPELMEEVAREKGITQLGSAD